MPVCLALQAAGTADGTGSHLDFPLLRRCAACNLLQILAADVFIYSCFFSWILCSRAGSVGPFKSSPRLWGQCCLVNTVEAETLKAGGLGSVCCCFQALEKCTNHFSFLLSALLWKEEAHAHWQSSCLGLTLSLHCSALMGAHQLTPSSVECLCHVIRAHTECIFGLKQCFWRASFEDKGEWEGKNEIQLEFWRLFYTDTHTENTQFSNLLLLFFLLLCSFDKNQFHFPMNKRCLLFFFLENLHYRETGRQKALPCTGSLPKWLW